MSTYLRILSYVKPYWRHLAASIGCTIMFALLNGASVYLSIPLLSTLFQEESGQTVQSSPVDEASSIMPAWLVDSLDNIKESFNEFIFSGTTGEILLKICLLILFAFLGKNVFGYMQAHFLAFVEQGVIKDIRNAAYGHLHKLPMSYFKNEKTGNLISRITNDVNVVQASISAVFLNMIREPLTIIVFLGIALSISWQLTLFSVVVLPFSLFIIGWVGLTLRKQSTILQEKMADITTVLHETITGIKIVKAFGMHEYENKKFASQTEGFFRLVLKMVRIRNLASPLTEFLSVVVGVVIIYYGGQLVLVDGTLKASEFLGFLFSIFQLMPPIKELSGVNNRIQESSAAGDRVFQILDTDPTIVDIPNAKSISDFNESITFDNVSFHYDDSDELVLHDVNFTIKKGQIFALVGSSGGGKTTMVDLLPRFFDPTDGRILIDDVDIKTFKIDDLRKLMGIVTQETVLFNESVKNNIAYGLSDFPDEKIIEAAKAANAHRFIIELSKGYDTLIGEKGTKLSGGQRQRISIARALLKNPPIMIFDEATSALDNESELLVQEAIERLMYDRTTIVIAHRLSTIRNADKILVLDKGKVIQSGNHDQLIEIKNGLYKKLYEMQFR
ncbi:MAG: ABC transporter ATP-binding protein/permease [Melioribacteraceae bacterium]|nr:ABC transporter ATP-binding protein/permease [Melioribacteraceae bacterium]MCF8353480.1 ABC transporter ATP-binding protein/permease [Melioribacteraceae bacterium]MCF8392609.1 ABC transporter ATP-binding protein/permease [Melioribacteraceae bacterium]MCF8418519.1 ABC transporter ATP-binding protein/permease [Melioribacteraceae bacterium]